MPSLKELKSRIKSIKSTQKITKAMQMVAASKLRKAREAVDRASLYASQMAKMIYEISSKIDESEALNYPLLKGRIPEKRVLLMVVSSDRGLCGSFNGSITKLVKRRVEELQASGKEVQLYFIGKKVAVALKKQYAKNTIEVKAGVTGHDVTFNEVQELGQWVLDSYREKKFDACEIIYSDFKSPILQVPVNRRLIPVSIDLEKSFDDKSLSSVEGEKVKGDKDKMAIIDRGAAFSYEPNEEEILNDLLPKNLKVQIYNSILISNASEHASRMTAMDNATKNSAEMVDNLSILYNRTRQAYITKELIEIISGAEAAAES